MHNKGVGFTTGDEENEPGDQFSGAEGRLRAVFEAAFTEAVSDPEWEHTDKPTGPTEIEIFAPIYGRMLLDQAAEQIKALAIHPQLCGVRWQELVLAVLAELRGDDA